MDTNEIIQAYNLNKKQIKTKNIASLLTILIEFIKIIIVLIFINRIKSNISTIIFIYSIISILFSLYILNTDKYNTKLKYILLDLSSGILFFSNIIGGILLESIYFKREKKIVNKLLKNIKTYKKNTIELFYEKKVYFYIFITIIIAYQRLVTNGIIESILFYLFIFFTLIIFFIKDIKRDLNNFKSNKSTLILITLRNYFLTAILSGILFLAVSFIVGEDSTNEVLLNQENTIFLFITSVIYAPIAEELLFRGCLRKIIKNDILFVLISGIGFGAWHVLGYEQSLMQYLYIIPYSCMGIMLSYTYTKTNNLATNIGIHLLNNLISSI